MDMKDYSEDTFNSVKEQVSKLLVSVGYKPDEVPFVPIASLKGDNNCKKSENMPWYTGPTLLEAINNLKSPDKPTNLPLRLPIQDVYSIQGIGVVPVGRVETGIMKVGQKVFVTPGREGKGISGNEPS